MFSKPQVMYFYGDCGEDEQKRVTNLMKKHGASVDFNVSDKCTHVISKTADFPDYVKAAAKKSIYIVTPEWVTQSAAKKKRLPESDFLVKAPEPAVPDLDESGQPGPRLFVGVRAAAVQMNATDKHRLAAIVRHHGGDFTGTLTPDSTHLIMLQPSGPIYLAAESRGLFIVSVQWVTESVSVGMRLDESDYALDMFTVEEKSSALAGLQRVPLPRSALENGVLAPVASILALPSPRPIPTAAPAPPPPATPVSPPRLKSAPSAVPAPAPAPASVPESEPTPVQSPPAVVSAPKPAILSRTRSTSGKPAATTPAAKRSSTIVESEEDVTMEDVPEPPKPVKTPSVKGVPAIVERPRHNDDDDNDMDEEMLKAQPILRGVSTARRAGAEPAAGPPPATTTTTTTTSSAMEGVVATSTVSNAKPPARGPRSRQSSVAAAASAPDPVTDNDEASAAGKVVVVAASAPAAEEDASEVTAEPETPTAKGGRGKKGAKKAAAAKKPLASAKKTPVAPSPSAEKSGPGDSSSTVEEEMPKSAKVAKKKALTPKPEPMEGVEQEAHVMLGDTRTTTPVLPEPPKEKEKEKSQPPLARTTSSGSRRSEVVKPEPSKGSKVLAPESPPQANSPTAVSPKAGVAFRPASFSQAKDAEAAPVTAAARAPSREASAAKAPLTVEVTAKETTPVAAPVVTTPTASQEQLRDLFLGTTFLVVYGNTEYCEKAVPELKKAGARIVQLPDIAGVTHVLARQLSEPGVDEARAAGAEVVSSFWLHDCFQERAYLSTHRKPIYMPPPSMQPVPDLPEKLLISFTGYVDDIRKELITMIEIMAGGRTVIDTNLKTAHTHLICLDSTGDKYKHASKWHIPRVTHRWIEAMFKNHRYIPETDFVFLQSNEAELKAEINARMVKNIQPEERIKYLQYKEATAPRPPPPVEVHPADNDATLDYGNEIGGGWGEVQVGGTGAMDTGGDEWIARPLSRARSTGPPSRGVESNTTAGTVVAPDDKARGQGSGAAAAGDLPNGDGKSGEEEPVPASEKKKRGKRAPKTPTAESTRTPRPRGKKPAAAAPAETPARTTSGSKAASARKRRRTDSDDEHDAGGDSATQDGDEAMGDVAEAEVEAEFETPKFKEPPKPVKPFFEEPSFEEPMSQFTSALISRQSPFAKPVQAMRKFSKPTTAQREANREYDYMDSQDNAGPATQESWQSPDEAPPPKKKQRRGSVTAATDMDVAHTTTTSTTSTTNGPAPTSPTATTTKRQSSTLSRQPSVAAGPVSQPPASDEAPTRVVPNFKKMHIMISCPRVDTQRLTKIANNLGIDVVPSQNASSLAPNATHIFMDSVIGDERFYCGLAKGLWFVRSSYLDKCSSVKKALPMEDYYEDTSERFGNVEIWSGAMRRWRQHREQTDKGAFEGWKVYCKGKLPMVRPILQAGGATLVRNLNDETIKDITCVITSESDEDEDPMTELMPYFEKLDGMIHDRDWIKRYLAEDPKKSPP